MCSNCSRIYVDSELGFEFSFRPLVVHLKHAFGTAHSVSSYRTNAALRFTYDHDDDPICGYGEVGLPPKKDYVYFCDLQDVFDSFNAFIHHLSKLSKLYKDIDHSLRDSVEKHDIFSFCSVSSRSSSLVIPDIIRFIFYLLDNISSFEEYLKLLPSKYLDRNLQESAIAPVRALVEMSLLDCLSKINDVPLHELMFGPSSSKYDEMKVMRSFVTVAMGGSVEEQEEKVAEALSISPHLKVKLDSDFEQIKTVFARIKRIASSRNMIASISVDFNASLSPRQAKDVIPLLLEYNVGYVEQPFPATILFPELHPRSERIMWQNVKMLYANSHIDLLADESAHASISPLMLSDYCSTVTLKLEKLGGIRACLRYLTQASSADRCTLSSWVSQMVSSPLNTTAAAILLLKVGQGDLDGDFLVERTEPENVGECSRITEGNVSLPCAVAGIGRSFVW